MSLMKSDNKNQREREREKERINSPERIRRRISVLLKSRPFVEPKKSSSLGTDILLFFGGVEEKKCHTQNNNIILTNEFLSSLSPLSFYSININRGSLQSVIRYRYHQGLLGQPIFVVVRVPRVLYASRIRDVMRRFGEI
jgi:hypothetical protein